MDNHDGLVINIDQGDIQRKLDLLREIRGGAGKAFDEAVKSTAQVIRTDAGKYTSQIYDIDSKSVTRRFSINYHANGVSVERKGPRFFARNFRHDRNPSPGVRGTKAVFLRPRRDGGGWELTADSQRGVKKSGVSKAFVATLPGRGRGVYVRVGNYRNRLAHARGLSVPEMVGNTQVVQQINDGAIARFNKVIDQQVNSMLNNKGAV